MMVLLVSQCEKKALFRTRRVLDAFADRIGERTWRTAITEEGLLTVKKLLKQTATKNTAVACHWMRSRVRSELLWIIGSKHKFNEQGIVPVNSTQKELVMDHINKKPLPGLLYANTQLQLLEEHLFAVGYVAEQLHKRLVPNKQIQSTAVFIAGCLHDLGKIDPQFQAWATNPKKKAYVSEDGQHIDDVKFSFEKYPRHNEISTLLYCFLDNTNLKNINPANKEAIKHAIFWHHAKPFRKEKGFESYKDIYSKITDNFKNDTFEDFLKKSIFLLKEICKIDTSYRKTADSELSKCFEECIESIDLSKLNCNLPKYKDYNQTERIGKYHQQVASNALNNILRACVISADRMVSSFSATELHEHIVNNTLDEVIEDVLMVESNLCSHIDTCLKQFPPGERTDKQVEVAYQLTKTQGVAVLAGPAGCGKTRIALEWAMLKQAKQIFWICPRVQVCQGLFYELTSDRYLPDGDIEICTGEFKFINQWDQPTPTEKHFSGDIVITTIDQIFNAIISHNKIDVLIEFLNVHVVFDEFHEYVNAKAFNLLFAELIACKQQRELLANTLLVSATPHYFYLNEILHISSEDIIKMPSFNQSLYEIEFNIFDESNLDDSNPLYQMRKTSTFVISNTAIIAQKSFIKNQSRENSVLLHSKFKKSDKKKWFGEVYESFKKDGTCKFDVLRSGPIVQASLNISCDYMVSEISSAEECLQRLGRLDRFGLNKDINIFCMVVPEHIHQGKATGAAGRFLSKKYLFGSTKAWYKILQETINNEPFKLSKIYDLYEEFHKHDASKKLIESDLIGSLKASVKLIDLLIMDPIKVYSKQPMEAGRSKIKKNSLRGDNRFVQMAVCEVSDNASPKILDKYAYEIHVNDGVEIDNLTASCELINGYGDSNKSLLANMMKKHHNIKGGKKAYKDSILLNEARDQEFPIYLSYTPSDLVGVGGESARHSEEIYYAVCDKQPIGQISFKELTSNEV